ncbi:MAG: STAS/SEC14 domain-containing protein [Flavobacteriales bacterium]|nr:STAS/SEC14 domain-containing protein [Flavobacteriales bacterium]
MIEKIKTFNENTLAIEVIGSFTETDEKLAQTFFKQKIDEGFEYVNVLIKLDELKLNQSSTKAFMEDIIWTLRNYKNMGNIAIVAHSKILKALVPLDAFFFERLKKGFEERYFDVSQIDKALEFVSQKKN